ncbi:MAG: amino acid permease [Bacteroidota bacterium]|nr:amino acid permease [Bacteroidota bacterium]
MRNDLFRRKDISAAIASETNEANRSLLKRALGLRDLTAMGIAAVIGAGIFSTIGSAAAAGGPGVSLLFVFTAIACGFSALCYAQFASMVPVAGSAYTYSYVAFGELVAWIIGWDLILEYAIGNVVVAISWSEYFTTLINTGLGRVDLHFPEYLSSDYGSVKSGFFQAIEGVRSGIPFQSLDQPLQVAYNTWLSAPVIGGLKIIFDLPALGIIALVTYLVYIGIKDTRNANNVLVALKLIVIITVIVVGAWFVDMDNWSPFAPNGMKGILSGVSAVFFAFIGFDAISTTAEECKDPQRDLPRSIMYSLVICTVLYVIIALVLTGMVPYTNLDVSDPLAYVFSRVGMEWMSGVVAVSAIIAMAGVLLVFQLGQPRIWMSMSRDGLLPGVFSRIHPKHRTPSFATIVTGFVVAVPVFLFDQSQLTDLTSIGTLFAFMLVCGGVLIISQRKDLPESRFKVPYFDSMIVLPCIAAIIIAGLWIADYSNQIEITSGTFKELYTKEYLQDNVPLLIFIVVGVPVIIASMIKRWSAIPVLGMLSCLYLMSELGISNWIRFGIWLGIGLLVYFVYGRNNSKLARKTSPAQL